MYMFNGQNEKQQIIKSNQDNITSLNQTDLEISKTLVDILQTENYTMHKSMELMLDKKVLKNDSV